MKFDECECVMKMTSLPVKNQTDSDVIGLGQMVVLCPLRGVGWVQIGFCAESACRRLKKNPTTASLTIAQVLY